MYQEYIGKVMTHEEAYCTFEGYNFAMVELEVGKWGEVQKGKVICISNNPLEIRKAFEPYRDQPRALLQGKMEEIDVPGVTLEEAIFA